MHVWVYRLDEFIWKCCNECASCYDAVRRYLHWLRSALTNRVLTALIVLMVPLRIGYLQLSTLVLNFIVLGTLMFHLSDEEKTQSVPLFQKWMKHMLCSVVVYSESSSLHSDFILYLSIWALTSFWQIQQSCDNISFRVVMATRWTTQRDVWSEEAGAFAGEHGSFAGFCIIVFSILNLCNTYGNRKTLHDGLLWAIINFGTQHARNLA